MSLPGTGWSSRSSFSYPSMPSRCHIFQSNIQPIWSQACFSHLPWDVAKRQLSVRSEYRPRPRLQYSSGQLASAIQQVAMGKSICQSAKNNGVPFTSLYRKVKALNISHVNSTSSCSNNSCSMAYSTTFLSVMEGASSSTYRSPCLLASRSSSSCLLLADGCHGESADCGASGSCPKNVVSSFLEYVPSGCSTAGSLTRSQPSSSSASKHSDDVALPNFFTADRDCLSDM